MRLWAAALSALHRILIFCNKNVLLSPPSPTATNTIYYEVNLFLCLSTVFLLKIYSYVL